MAGTRVLAEQFPEVQATGAPGNDYQDIRSSPAMFGGLIAQAEDKLGAGMESASGAGFQVQAFYNQTSADAQTNAYNQKQLNRYYGDPNDPSKPGYFALKGSDATAAWPQVRAQDEQDRQELGASLNPVARQQYENDTRRAQLMMLESGGRHATQQYDVAALSVQKSKIDNALRNAGLNYNSDDAFNQSAADIGAASANILRQQGTLTDDTLKAELDANHSKLVASRVEGLLTRNPQAAKDFLDKQFADKGVDAQTYDQLTGRLRPMLAGPAADDAIEAARKTQPQQQSGVSANYNARVARIESSNGQASSNIYQFVGGTAQRYGVNATSSPAEQEAAMNRLTADNRAYLQSHGVPINDVTLYMAHQQGAGGAQALVNAPDNAIAANIVGTKNAQGNRPFFYGSDGQALTVAQSKAVFAQKMGAPVSATQTAGIGTIGSSVPTAPASQTPALPEPTPAPPITPLVTSPVEGGAPQQAAQPAAMPQTAQGQQPPAQTERQTIVAAPSSVASASLAGIPTGLPDEPTAIQHAYDAAKGDPVQARLNVAAVKEKYVAARAAVVDQQHAMEVQKKQQEAASDAAEIQIVKQAYTPGSKINLQQAMATPGLTREALERLPAIVNRADRPDPAPGTSRDNTLRILSDMRRPYGDPLKISDSGPIYDAFLGQQISKTDFDFLQSQQSNLKTPEGERLSSLQSDFVKRMTSSITQSNPVMGKIHPAGDQMLYAFNYFVNDEIARYKDEKKNPYDLFNPAKPDYLGNPKTMAPFQKSMQDSTDDINNQMRGIPIDIDAARVIGRARATLPGAPAAPQPAVAPTPAAAVQNIQQNRQRQPGETPAAYLARVGAAGNSRFALPTPQEVQSRRPDNGVVVPRSE